MAAPRKKKKTPPFDVTGIDFSVITTALETGGKMIEQIMNGIQYGSPEVRLLMLEECDFILECRVCRGLFRALPNFIAHKRVYCCRAYSDFVHDTHFQAATAVVPPPDPVVEPEAPEDAPPKTLRLPRQAKDKGGKDEQKDRVGADTSGAAAAATTTNSKKNGKPPTDGSKSNTKPQQVASQQPPEASNGKAGGKTRSQQSEKAAADRTAIDSLQRTVAQIESGQLGKSPEYAFYTAAADKAEREKGLARGSEAFHLTPIPAAPCAVFVSKGSLPQDPSLLPSVSSSLPPLVDGATEIREKQPMKNSPKEGSTAAVGQEDLVRRSAGGVQATAAMSGSRENAKKCAVSKATLRSVTKVVKELRQKKEERTSKEELALQKNKAQKTTQKNRKPILLSILSESKTTGSLPPSSQRTDPLTVTEVRSGKDPPPPYLASPSPTPSCRSGDQAASDAEQSKDGGSLRAVVKRCLTGRPGSVRVSPFKPGGDWNLEGGDNVSEAGSHSDKGEAAAAPPATAPPLPRQDSTGDQKGAMDVENLCCTICNKKFAAKKSLLYHCQTRHSGQRTIFPCPYCTGVFYYFWGLTRHLNTNHKKTRSAIDRMRQGLHSKAYKQVITEEEMTGAGVPPARRPSSKGKNHALRKGRPSVHAKKIVAASKSAGSRPSTSGEAKKTPPPNALYLPSRRRRVEVITSVKSKCKQQSADLYKKVYANKRTEAPVGSSVTGGAFSSPLRTRKIVAKALRTTRSKRVYNRSDIDSPPLSPKKVVTQKTVTAKPGALTSIKRDPSPDLSCTRSSTRETVTAKDEPKESKPASSSSSPAAAAQRNSSKLQTSDAKDGKMGDRSLSSDCCKPVAGTEPSREKPQGVTVIKIQPAPQPQTRTRASSGVPVVVPTTTVSSGSVSSLTAPRISTVTVPRVAPSSSARLGQGRRVYKDSSGLLHICPHCHRAFGRKISLESHIQVCSRAKGPDAKSEAPKDRSLQTSPSTQRSSVRRGEEMTGSGDMKSHDPPARTGRSSSRALRESSVEKSEPRPKPPPNALAHPQDLRSHSRSGSSRGSSVDRQVTVNKSGERESRSRKRTDSKASSSRESSVDSVRTRRSESRPPQLSAERSSAHRESESSQDGWVDGRNSSRSKLSVEDNNLLTLSRQRLSEHLLAATITTTSTTTTKDPAVTKPRSESRRSSVSGDSVSDSRKSDFAHTNRSSPEKPASPRTVTTTVLRKGLKGKLPDSPRKVAPEPQPASSSSNAVSSASVKHSAGNPKPMLEQKVVVSKSVVQSRHSAGNPKPTLEQKAVVTKSVVQTKHSAGNPKPTLEQKVAITKSVVETKHSAGNPKPTLEQKAVVTKSVVQTKHSAGNPKPTLEQKVTVTKSVVQSRHSTSNPKPTLEQKVAVTKSVVQSRHSTSNPKPTLEQKVAVTKSVVQSRHSTSNPKPTLEQKVAVTKLVTQERPSAKPSLQDTSPAPSGLQEKTATKPATPDKPTAQLEKSQPKPLSTATKPLPPEKPAAAKLATEANTKTPPPLLQEKSAAPQEEKLTSALQEKSVTPKPSPQVQDSKLLKGETKPADCSSDRPRPNLPQKPHPISEDSAEKEAPSPQQATPTAAAAEKVTRSEQPAPETSELNQRPRRKRRAPARVMDSGITLPNYITPKKKACQDPAIQRSEEEESSLSKRTTSQKEQMCSEPTAVAMMTRTRKEAGEDRESVAMTTEEEVRAERKTGRPSDRTRSRTYVVEPSQAGRLTCQDIRKVEEIVDETGLTCRHCEQQFTSVSNLRRHAIRHLGWKRFKCRLCFFCSYNRSECNTHIVRTHGERVRQGGNNARTDSFILDLSRQARTVHSLMKRQTLDRQRQGETAEGEEKEEGAAATPTLLRGSRSRKNAQASSASPEDPMTMEQAEDSCADAEASSSAAPLSRRAAASSRAKPAVPPAATEAAKPKPPTPTPTFNISTRNSPRKFDTRPYTRDDSASTLNTRKGAYAKQNLSFSSPSGADAGVAEENKKADAGGKDGPLSSVAGSLTVNTVTGSSSSSSSLVLDSKPDPGQKTVVENTSRSAAGKDQSGVGEKRRQDCEPGRGDQGRGPPTATATATAVAAGEEKSTATAAAAGTTVSEKSVEREGSQEDERSEFVKRRRDDGDLMDVEELKTLPEHFMSDDDDD